MSCCAFPGLALSISSLLPISQPPIHRPKRWKIETNLPLRCLTDYKHRKPTSNPLTRSLTSPITFGTYLSPCPLRLRRPSRDRFFPMQKKPFPTQGRGWITVIRSRSTDSRERLCFPGKFSSLDKWRREWKKTREEPAKGTVKWPGSGGKTKSAFEIFEKGRGSRFRIHDGGKRDGR